MSEGAIRRSLAAREDRFRTLFEQSMDAIYIVAPDGTTIEVNQAWLDLFGYSRAEVATFRAIDLYANPSDRDSFLGRIAETGFVRDEVRFRRKDGSEFDCERTVVALKDAAGAVIAYQGVNRDVTERRRAEEALRGSERRYRSLFENSMDAIYIGSPDGKVIDVNQAWLDLFGYERDDLPGLDASVFYADPADRTDFVRRMTATGHVQDEVRYRRKDGTTFDCQRIQTAIRDGAGNVVAYQGINRDITARKQAEAALRESEERYRTLFELSRDATYLVKPDGTFINVNQAWLDLLGCTPEDVNRHDAAHWYAEPDGRKRYLERMATAGPVLDDEVKLRRQDGTVFDCQRRIVARWDKDGNTIAYQGVMRDVTEMREAERALRASEERFRSLFEQSWDANYVGTPEGAIIDVNQSWLDLFGYSRGDLSNLTAFDLYADPADRGPFLRRMAAEGRVQDEVRYKKKDGTVFDCERTVVARKDEQGRTIAYQGIFRNVSQRKRDRAELERLARFDALTGAFNRRSILEKLDEWVRHVRRYKGHLSVVMLDIDHFKLVNDRHGHQVGDHVLADTATLLQRSVRQTDFVGRYGGEEFLIILPRTDAAGATVMAQRTRAIVQGTTMHDAEGGMLGITASLGVAEWGDEDDEDALIRRADAALYRAKAAGRNRVEVAASPGQDTPGT
ncbi:MAG: PAS domain S-box protein [Dehalococcoidia bacterium]|jgi:diguanylate cyclase (GGDEF)-like protein/PAS domain S-box-containing protein|nr:PAS domain S-box protein [Dehalococcoidia bacterium]